MTTTEDNFLEVSTAHGDTITIGCKDEPKSKLEIQWDGGDGWNIYRDIEIEIESDGETTILKKHSLLCNIPFESCLD